ncbi:hypothetical protein CWI75_13275 [Kineobactrum sediminis]|uniref:Uncharacterized protein n=1 Tax=Kineobactrum sediminis TaxID=1905677 RepID=A0A2N5Y0Y2_9GAMM|nr:hypothetical protein [Kineobactrum sediminis]PLW82048.1 hypothetical protein CWI75_13275 [Kineobactrum sediminis]
MKMISTGIVMTLWILGSSVAFGQNDKNDPETRQCLPMSHIDRIEVVDDQTLIFHMHGKTDYINHLPYKCHGLKHNAILHETSLNSYCSLDIISVVDTTIGMRMGSCPLGKFEPYTEPEE